MIAQKIETNSKQYVQSIINADTELVEQLTEAATALRLDYDTMYQHAAHIASERLKLADLELLYIVYPDSRAVVAKAVKDLHDIALNMFRTSYPERVDYLNDIVENPI